MAHPNISAETILRATASKSHISFFDFIFKQNNLPSYTMPFRPERKIKKTSFIKNLAARKVNYFVHHYSKLVPVEPAILQRQIHLSRD